MATSPKVEGLPAFLVAAALVAAAACDSRGRDTEPASPPEEPVGAAQSGARPPLADCLYVGDNVLGTEAVDDIDLFDPFAGTYYGQFIRSGEVRPHAITGLVFARQNGANPDLVVVDQNTGQNNPGEVFRYRKPTGKLRDVLVPITDPNAPYAPRGTILHDSVLYVADVGDDEPFFPGQISTYDAKTGQFLGNLNGGAFPPFLGPRGLVIGPDGFLYASVFNHQDPLDGQIVRFDPATGQFLGIFIDSDTCNCDLNRPEGVAFGPDGNLYVTSFANTGDPTSVDKILIFHGETGQFLDQIDLWQAGVTPRAAPQTLLFGPGGKLYLPITGGSPATTGQLRVYDVSTKTYTLLAPAAQAGGPLQRPVYLTFCSTDPATLAYDPQKHCECGK